MSLPDDVFAFLIAQGAVDGSSGWKGAIGFIPTDPNKVICIYATGGEVADTRQSMRYMTFQIRGRGDVKGYNVLQQKMEALFQLLHTASIDNTEAGASPTLPYVLVHAVQSAPLSLGEDENKRPHMTLNFRVIADS